MRDSNFIKMDEKYIPHFMRTELFTSGGGTPEGKEGEQYSHIRDAHSIPTSEHDVSLIIITPRPLTLSFG